jgi:hypothetical protein
MEKNCQMIHLVETPNDVFWSKRKMTATYKHCEFLYNRELPQVKFNNFKELSTKQFWEMKDE